MQNLIQNRSKIRFQLENPYATQVFADHTESKLARRLKRNMLKRMEEVNFDQELVETLRDCRNDILRNLIEEENFRVPLNSMNNKSDTIQEILNDHTNQMAQMVEKCIQKMGEMTQEIVTVKEKVKYLETKLSECALTQMPRKNLRASE